MHDHVWLPAALAIAMPMLGCGGSTGDDLGDDVHDVDGAPGPEPCDLSVDSPSRVTYYVAATEPGADNAGCDGLAPTDQGGGHCPFRDFTSLRVREVLFRAPDGSLGVTGVTVLVRTGTYQIEPIVAFPGEPPIPLWVYGLGTTAADAVVLAAYPGEHPVLDGTCDEPVPECSSPEDPGRVWILVYLWGAWDRVTGMTFQGAHKWNLTVGSASTCVEDNELIGPHGSDSDSIKSFDGSGPFVVIRRNDFHDFAEQLIDATSSDRWLITDNDFHDAGKGVGFKHEAHGSIVRDNRFWNLDKEAVSLGAATPNHDAPYEAWDLVFERNHVRNVGENAIQVVYCKDCVIRSNLIEAARLGIRAPDQGTPGCPGAGGCSPTTGLVIEHNVLRDLPGGGGAPPDTFVVIDPAVTADFAAGDNLYCIAAGATDTFWNGGTDLLRFPAWVDRTATDATSRVGDRAAADCSITEPPP